MLTTKQIEALKAKDLQYKVNDAEQLYIIVTPHGVKSWRTNYKDKISGKYKTHTFGRFPEIGLAQARLLNSEFKDDLAHGEGKMPTFDEVKVDWLKHKLPTLKNVKHQQQIVNRVEYHVSPLIGDMPINKISRSTLRGNNWKLSLYDRAITEIDVRTQQIFKESEFTVKYRPILKPLFN